MSQNVTEQTVDARALAPRDKHQTIFKTWNSLLPGESLLLINDHDPLPLYFQFSCEHTGEFHWEYLDKGPQVWRVRIAKGNFADPGFVPPKKAALKATASHSCCEHSELVLDVRPIFERGATPCGEIDDSVAALKPNQDFVLLVPFEPAPLYAKLGRDGFEHQSTQLPDGTWRVVFKRS